MAQNSYRGKLLLSSLQWNKDAQLCANLISEWSAKRNGPRDSFGAATRRIKMTDALAIFLPFLLVRPVHRAVGRSDALDISPTIARFPVSRPSWCSSGNDSRRFSTKRPRSPTGIATSLASWSKQRPARSKRGSFGRAAAFASR